MADTRDSERLRRSSSRGAGFNGPGGSTRPGTSGPGDTTRPANRSGFSSSTSSRPVGGVKGGFARPSGTGGSPLASTNAGSGTNLSDRQEERFKQLDAEAKAKQATEDAARVGRNEEKDAAESARKMAGSNYENASNGNAKAGEEARDAEKDAASALKSGSKATGINMGRPLSDQDWARHSSNAERAAAGTTGQNGLAMRTNTGAGGGFDRVRGFFRRHRTGTVVGTSAGGLFLAGIMAFALLIPLQLLDMANMMLHAAQQDVEHEVDKAGLKILQKMIQSREKDPGGTLQHTGHPIADAIHNVTIKKFNDDLYKDGIKITFDKSGRLTGIEYLDDSKNIDLSDASFTARRSAIKDLVFERISPWRPLARILYTRRLQAWANVSWRFWPKEKVANIAKLMWEKVRQGATVNEIQQETGESEQQAAQEQAAAQSSGETDATGDIGELEQKVDGGEPKTQAIRDVVASIKSHPAFGITGMVALICIVEQIANRAATHGYVQRADLLMRMGNLIPTMASQLVTGDGILQTSAGGFNIDELNQAMQAFQGDPKAPSDSLDRLSWAQSASARRDMGLPVNSNPKSPNFNPDFNEAANPDGNALVNVIGEFTSVFNSIPGASFTCSILTGVFGTIVQIGLQIVEFAVNIVDGETEEILSSAADVGIQTALFGWVLPKVLEAGAGLAVTGNENPVDMFNNGQAGLSLASEQFMRSMGGRELTNTEEADINNSAQGDQFNYAESQGWRYNLFAISNPNSLLARTVINIPDTPGQALADMMNVPSSVTHGMATVFLGIRPASADANNINPYGWQMYGFTDAEIDKYDPIANEDFLTQPVKKPDGTYTTRLAMLGDPSHYVPTQTDDPDQQDLLHCFVDKYSEQHNGDGFANPNPGDVCDGLGLATTRDGNEVFNPTDQQIVNTIYCQNNNVCNLQPNDDFLRYRLELLYTDVVSSMDCETTTVDCFTGNDPYDD